MKPSSRDSFSHHFDICSVPDARPDSENTGDEYDESLSDFWGLTVERWSQT